MAAPEQRIGLPAIPRPRRSPLPAFAAGAAVLAVAGALGYAIVLERDRIVAAFPRAEPLFALVGLGVNDPGAGLEIRNLATSRETDSGQPTLVITGEVANVTSVERRVPKLAVILRDRDEHELQDWTFEPPLSILAPGEAVPFRTSVARPADEAVGVIVTIAKGGG